MMHQLTATYSPEPMQTLLILYYISCLHTCTYSLMFVATESAQSVYINVRLRDRDDDKTNVMWTVQSRLQFLTVENDIHARCSLQNFQLLKCQDWQLSLFCTIEYIWVMLLIRKKQHLLTSIHRESNSEINLL